MFTMSTARYDPNKDGEIDKEILPIVRILRFNHIDTCYSCQGGKGHPERYPLIQFYGTAGAGNYALSVAQKHGIAVQCIRKTWYIHNSEMVGPVWEMVLHRTAVDLNA